MGTFKEIRRSFISKENREQRSCYLPMDGRVSLTELIDYLKVTVPHLTLDDFQLNFATVTWVDNATDEEKAIDTARQLEAQRKHEEWERNMYNKLKEKYGD